MSEERRDQDVPRGLPDTGEVRRSPVEGGGGSLGGEASERDASALHRGDELILPAPRRRTRQQIRQERRRRKDYTPRERLLILDAWTRTRLPAKDFGGLLGISIHTLYRNVNWVAVLAVKLCRAFNFVCNRCVVSRASKAPCLVGVAT
jgi:hypothetical protein